jgi:hypothetical protein
MRDLLFRFVAGGLIVSFFAILGDALKPKSFAGLFGAAPSVALATLGLTIVANGKVYAALETRSMIAGACAFCFYASFCACLMARYSVRALPATIVGLAVWIASAICGWRVFLRLILSVSITFDLAGLRRTRWYEYVLRFFFGGAVTVIAGLIAKYYGPVFGGLFLAFPAIFPASATLVETHEAKKKRLAGIIDHGRGRKAAALDARGAALGSLGLVGFAIALWRLLPHANATLSMAAGLAVWLGLSLLLWRVSRFHFRG